jgi:hypothetical protein
VIARLIEALGNNANDKCDNTALMSKDIKMSWDSDVVNELANLKADLSIINNAGDNIYEMIEKSETDNFTKNDALRV